MCWRYLLFDMLSDLPRDATCSESRATALEELRAESRERHALGRHLAQALAHHVN